MNRIIVLIMILFIHFIYATGIMVVDNVNKNSEDKNSNHLIGGWSPVFFSQYDDAKIKEIVSMVEKKQVKAIKISYPSNGVIMAKKIKDKIESTTKIAITMEKLDLKDTEDTKYNHNQVVVVLYYKLGLH